MFLSRHAHPLYLLTEGNLLHKQVWVHEQSDGRLDIVDGKQRITSLLSFLDGIFPRHGQRFTLEGLETLEQLNGKARDDLSVQVQQHLQDYPLSLRILGQHSGAPICACLQLVRAALGLAETLACLHTHCLLLLTSDLFWGASNTGKLSCACMGMRMTALKGLDLPCRVYCLMTIRATRGRT